MDQGEGSGSEVVVPLLEESRKNISMKYEEESQKAGFVSWSPPVPNWNPWTACNIDEGHMASVSELNNNNRMKTIIASMNFEDCIRSFILQ